MFSESYYGEVRQYFDRQMALLKGRAEELRQKETELQDADKSLWRFSRELLEQKTEEIQSTLADCTEDEREALVFLYSAMPLSDMLDYPAAVYLAYVRHGVFLWQEGPFAGKVPERIFANYVLHYRVHNEDIVDTRRFFYDMLKKRTQGKSMYDAAMEANMWCAETTTYQSTFMRTQNPRTMYGTGIGRCGEGAPFASTAFRSIGIPAREVATPWWAHCDDNHAWVEVWCDGKWYFLGGGEPEATLNAGWFKGPTTRAMMINSRWFGKDEPLEPVTGRPDMSAKVNHLRLYADTLELRVKVLDSEGNPLPGVKVDFCLLNYGRFGSIATLVTGEDPENNDYGAVRLETGYGDLLVCAHGGGLYGEKHISLTELSRQGEQDSGSGVQTRPLAEYIIVAESGIKGLGEWKELDFHAPREIPYDERKTEEQFAAEKVRLESAAESRRRRSAEFYDEALAERVLMRFSGEDREALDRILHEARGNMGEIVRFLEWDFAGRTLELVRQYGQEKWKLEALRTLRHNDYWDIRAEVLAECCVSASPYAAGLPKEIFFRSLLAPCVLHETPRACREALAAALGKTRSEMIRQNPQCLSGILEKLLVSMPEQEYANLVASPIGCLTGGIGSRFSRGVLYVQIYRTLGIPARMRPMDRTIEYYKDGRFLPVDLMEEGAKDDGVVENQDGVQDAGKLVLRSGESLKLEDWKNYSLSRFCAGSFEPLFIRPGMKRKSASGSARNMEGVQGGEASDDESLELELAAGIYRLVTTNRLPNGNQFVRIYDFELSEGETKQVELSMRDISSSALLERRPVKEMALHTSQGEGAKLSALGGEGRSLFLWLELAKEPTEHVLNELCERKERFGGLNIPIYFVVRQGSDYQGDGTLRKACEALPQAKVLVDEFGDGYGDFSCQAGRNPGKLPLAVILENGRDCVYSDAGYNVGMADMLLRILELGQESA